jgi:hypothetical protein
MNHIVLFNREFNQKLYDFLTVYWFWHTNFNCVLFCTNLKMAIRMVETCRWLLGNKIAFILSSGFVALVNNFIHWSWYPRYVGLQSDSQTGRLVDRRNVVTRKDLWWLHLRFYSRDFLSVVKGKNKKITISSLWGQLWTLDLLVLGQNALSAVSPKYW